MGISRRGRWSLKSGGQSQVRPVENFCLVRFLVFAVGFCLAAQPIKSPSFCPTARLHVCIAAQPLITSGGVEQRTDARNGAELTNSMPRFDWSGPVFEIPPLPPTPKNEPSFYDTPQTSCCMVGAESAGASRYVMACTSPPPTTIGTSHRQAAKCSYVIAHSREDGGDHILRSMHDTPWLAALLPRKLSPVEL